MKSFLKSFFAGEKTAEEQSLQKKHDIIMLDIPADENEEEEQTGCCGGCGGGCH